MTTYWAPLLHVYQPYTQDVEVLETINKECYKPLFSMIDKHDNAKFCLNINGVLIELLYKYGLADTMDLLKNLVAESKIEVLGTAIYHPILPLIPKKEAYHQIRMNEEVNRKEFGNSWQRKGFFPPEMAISSKLVNIIKEIGYKWVIMSGIACPEDWAYDKIYTSPKGLKLFFRDDVLSNKIAFKNITAKIFVKEIKAIFLPDINNDEHSHDKSNNSNRYIISAMDGEAFGHHIKNYEKIFLKKTLDLIDNDDEVQTVFISELDQYFPIAEKAIIPRDSSWSTSYGDIVAEIPYPLWQHPENNIHKYYWKIMKSLNRLLNLASNLDLTENWDVEKYYNTARWFYDRGIYSCPVWWANPQNGTWSPNLIYKGLEFLMKTALNAQLALVHARKNTGDGYFDIISYYHGLLVMELYSMTKRILKKK
jgi:alpha-amylase/alpha-mannosidase (GH57 family)